MSESPGWLGAEETGGKKKGKSSKKNVNAAGAADPSSAGPTDTTADRTALISARLKAIYRKAVLPVEKRYRYDYFFESPLLTDTEFDGKLVLTL